MINKFARCASNYSYYGYLNRYTPEQLRSYQSERYYYLGRRGAFDNLVTKMAADHINYEEDLNMKYKIPHVIVKFSYKLAMYWMLVSAFIIMFGLGDMGKTLKPKDFFYINKPSGVESARHYETLYLIDRIPKY